MYRRLHLPERGQSRLVVTVSIRLKFGVQVAAVVSGLTPTPQVEAVAAVAMAHSLAPFLILAALRQPLWVPVVRQSRHLEAMELLVEILHSPERVQQPLLRMEVAAVRGMLVGVPVGGMAVLSGQVQH